MDLKIRTDLALETKESLDEAGRLRGVVFDEKTDGETGIKISRLEVLNALGEKNMGRAKGVYYTFETVSLSENDGGYHRKVSEFFSEYIKETVKKHMKNKPPYHILVAGLGNREATPDALGPYVVNNLEITEGIGEDDNRFGFVSAIAPGVLAQTGMETAEIVQGVVSETKPDVVVAIDALAARSVRRLNRTIQITDTGIHPGSGVGNHRNGLTEENLQVKVIGIGVPTVVDAATIVHDSMEHLLDALEETEQKEFLEEMIAPNLYSMFVTPKDVDETVKYLSFTISEGLNIAFSEV